MERPFGRQIDCPLIQLRAMDSARDSWTAERGKKENGQSLKGKYIRRDVRTQCRSAEIVCQANART